MGKNNYVKITSSPKRLTRLEIKDKVRDFCKANEIPQKFLMHFLFEMFFEIEKNNEEDFFSLTQLISTVFYSVMGPQVYDEDKDVVFEDEKMQELGEEVDRELDGDIKNA